MTQREDGEQKSLPLELERQVDALCLEFEKAWREKQTAPRVEDYAQPAPEVARRVAIRELIAQGVDLRREEGEAVDAREYHGWFPQNGPEVKAAFALLAHRAPVAPKHQPEEEPLPERIGRYVIHGTLGKGGYGLVYLARDTELDRQVALKAPLADWFSSPEAMESFVREARTVAQFDDPGIGRVYDVFRESDRVVIVMQYVEGQDLAKRLKVGGRMSPEEAAGLIMQVAKAIAFAHQRAFWRRDLKPANILLDRQGRPHVADFGLAIHESDQGGKAGERVGTALYMSPEQVRGEAHPLDGRSDIWSLGVILYEMLAGRCPFAGANHGELFDEIEHHDPKLPRMSDPELPSLAEALERPPEASRPVPSAPWLRPSASAPSLREPAEG